MPPKNESRYNSRREKDGPSTDSHVPDRMRRQQFNAIHAVNRKSGLIGFSTFGR
jgi:hypothetical protein